MLVEILEEGGFEVVAVYSAHVGFDVLAFDFNQFHLVLTDPAMPRVSGANLCRILRTRCFSGPIVQMSGDQTQLDRELEAGATVCLLKPFTIDGILTAIDHCLSRGTVHGQLPGLEGTPLLPGIERPRFG